MLKFIMGTAGSGKTSYINKLLCEEAKGGNNRLMLLVPDQSSFQSEKNLLEMCGAKALTNIKVFGFSRLCDYIFSNTTAELNTMIDECDCAYIMSMAVEEIRENLHLYRNVRNKELTQIMLSAVNEYKKCRISSDALRGAALKIRDKNLRDKLFDTTLAYEAYEALLENKYTDPLSRQEAAAKALSCENLFEDYIVAVDAFNNFTAAEYEILGSLMKSARDFYCTLVYTENEDDKEELFFTGTQTMKIIKKIAVESGIKIAPNTVLHENFRSKNEELKYLEQSFYRSDKVTYDEKPENIEIYAADNIYDECEYIAGRIKKAVVEQNCRYSDFAVITGSEDKYSALLLNTFEKYSLRCFTDITEDVFKKPLFRLINLIFNCLDRSVDVQSLLDILKSGLLNTDIADVADFENYLYVYDVTSAELKRKFTKNPDGFGKTEDSTKVLEKIEALRRFAVNPLVTFKKNYNNKTAAEISKGLYNLLLSFGVNERLISLSKAYESIGELKYSEEQIRLWNCFIEAINKTISIAGEHNMSLSRFYELFAIRLEQANMGFIPEGQDLITIGTIDRIRLTGKKIVFLAGVIEGEMPLLMQGTAAFTDEERRTLLNLDLELDYAAQDALKQEKLMIYHALSYASDKVFFSYHISTMSGETVRPSTAISEVIEIFPKIKVITSNEIDKKKAASLSERKAFEYFVENYGNDDSFENSLMIYFSQKEEYKSKIDVLYHYDSSEKLDIRDKSVCEELFGKKMSISASSAEKYYTCAFSYLCTYGFKARERNKVSLNSLEYGSFMHYILEKFFAFYPKTGFSKLSDEQLSLEVDTYIARYINDYIGGLDDKSERFEYLLKRIKTTAMEILKHICEELTQSKFKPEFFEYRIGKNGKIKCEYNLENENSVSINGSIDRVDTMQDGEKTFVRIIDYKTSSKSFNLYDILSGVNMQMLIYLNAIRKNTEMIPAGILYMPAISTVIDGHGLTDKQIREEQGKLLVMNGLILNQSKVLTGMEERLEGRYIPVKLNPKTQPQCLVTDKQLELIFNYIDKKIKNMANNVYLGNFAPSPLQTSYDACAYCPYADVCRSSNENIRPIYKMKNDVAVDKMQAEVEINE